MRNQLFDIQHIRNSFVKNSDMTKREKLNEHPYLTTDEVADLLKCSTKTVYNYTKRGILKRHTFGGRRIYYLRSEVESAMFPLD